MHIGIMQLYSHIFDVCKLDDMWCPSVTPRDKYFSWSAVKI